MNQEKIGKFIAESRKKEKMTQETLAEKLGVNSRTISRWENGKNMPDVSLFEPLCKELHITINELLAGEKLNHNENLKYLSSETLVEYSKYLSNKSMKKIIWLTSIILIMLVCLSVLAILIYNKTFFSIVYNSEYLDNVNVPIPELTYYRGTGGLDVFTAKLKTLKQSDEVNIHIDGYLSRLEKIECNDETYYYDKNNDFTIIQYRINNDGIGFINTIYITYANGKYCG